MKCALALFAKTPIPGLVKTRLAPSLSAVQSADLYRCMLLDTIARTASLPCDTFIFYDGDQQFFSQAAPSSQLIPQKGDHLGSRLEHAFAAMGALGYEVCAVIGTDAPDLPLDYIEEAFSSLAAGSDVVFGPAEDGGYYLVAQNGICATLFEDIPWSGDRVLEQSLERAGAAGLSVALLPPWYDVDSFEDLYRPGLSDPSNAAPLTREFISRLGLESLRIAGAGKN
jgi:uncharacterized protein